MWVWVTEVLRYHEARQERKREFLIEQTERVNQHELDLRVCNSCEVMKAELNKAHSRELELLELLKPVKREEPEVDTTKRFPINQHIPWSVKCRQLEAAARVKKITADDLDTELEEVRGK